MKENAYCRCLYFSANALARSITRMAEEEFAATGLPPSYAFILMTVNKQPGLAAGEIAATMLLDPSTITRLMEKLETKGYIKRHSEGKFTRVYPLAPSLELDPVIKQAWKKLYERYTAALGDLQTADLAQQLFSLSQKLE
jgi:DNA-binding MarR family transcriptional regulator